MKMGDLSQVQLLCFPNFAGFLREHPNRPETNRAFAFILVLVWLLPWELFLFTNEKIGSTDL